MGENYEKLIALRRKFKGIVTRLNTARLSPEDEFYLFDELDTVQYEINWLGEFTDETVFELK